MIAKEIISDIIPPLKTSDSASKALKFMNEFHVGHLPIVNNAQFLGLISEEDILDLSKPDEPIGNHALSLSKVTVNENQHIYEVIKIASGLKLTLVPVVDDHKTYVGCITLKCLVDSLAKINAIKDPGGVIMLEINSNDYSLAEIARLVESNDASILSAYLNSPVNSSKMSVTLKINKTDLKHIIATFERFEYNVTAYYQESDYNDYLKDRLDSFINYLNI